MMSTGDSDVVTIKVSFAIRRRGGRKLVLAPDGAPMPPTAPYVDSTLIKAVARAFRWQNMLEAGRYATIKEIAKAEKINPSYVSRVLRLTLLSPSLVDNIVFGRHPACRLSRLVHEAVFHLVAETGGGLRLPMIQP